MEEGAGPFTGASQRAIPSVDGTATSLSLSLLPLPPHPPFLSHRSDRWAGRVWGLTGSRALYSPSIYWVWEPSSVTAPPYNNRPALYRLPIYGGIPEIVTLHALPCQQMSIVDVALRCLANGVIYAFDLRRPNSAYEPLEQLGNTTVAFVNSRQLVALPLDPISFLLV